MKQVCPTVYQGHSLLLRACGQIKKQSLGAESTIGLVNLIGSAVTSTITDCCGPSPLLHGSPQCRAASVPVPKSRPGTPSLMWNTAVLTWMWCGSDMPLLSPGHLHQSGPKQHPNQHCMCLCGTKTGGVHSFDLRSSRESWH